MAQVFGEERLDFVLFFSSLMSFSKSVGQSNYAAGCSFEDAFAHQLARNWSCPVKIMNWGYWGSVGGVASEKYQGRMARAGIASIEPAEGMAALEQLLGSPREQVVFVKTTRPLSLNGGAATDVIYVYPEETPSTIVRLQNRHKKNDYGRVSQNVSA
jgi:polyketide synthase PksM